MALFGLLNIDKPGGLTSRRAVDHVQRLVWPAKAGHAGTLDPLASGVLIMCVGKATRLIEYVQRMPKRYRATFLLGRSSDTEDVEGQVREHRNAPVPSRGQIERAIPRFIGQIQQRPPVFSALKLHGRRAYDLARMGKDIELPPRPVTIHGIELVRFEYPELELDVCCGSGTYIRALGRDLADAAGTAAVMSALVRTAIGSFTIDEATNLHALTPETLNDVLLPARLAVEELSSMTLTAEDLARVARGQAIRRMPPSSAKAEIAALDESGRLAAILELAPEGLRPVRNFSAKT